mgnify:FL=1
MSEQEQIATEVVQEAPEVNPVEEEARAQGWVGKDEFRGSDDDWVDADTFVKRGKEIMPILRKNNEKLLKELGEAKKAAEEARSAALEFKKYQQDISERKIGELQSQIEHLKQAKRDAITTGDGDRVIAIDDAIDEIKEQQREAKSDAALRIAEVQKQQQQAVTLDPTFNAWLDRNKWFGSDNKLTSVANALGESLRRDNPNLIGADFLTALDKELQDTFPDKFGKVKRQSPVEGGSHSGRSSGGRKSYDNLPAEAKTACDRFVKQGLMTREQYIADYEWN